MENNIMAIVMAAGKGTRMKSKKSKLVQKIYGKEIVKRAVENAQKAGVHNIVAVVGYMKEQVMGVLGDTVKYAVQEEMLGTGHAVMQAAKYLEGKKGKVLVLNGDVPILRPETLNKLLNKSIENKECATLLTAIYDNPTGYGRIVRDEGGNIQAIVEEKDTTEPVITVQNEDPRIKITVTDDTALDYIIYKYGDNEEVKVEASEDDPTKIEAYIDNVLETQVTLKIEAVDKAQNFATKEQQVKGATKPKIEVVSDPTDQSYLIIRASDNEGLRMVVFYINEDEYKTDPNTSLNMKNFEYRQKVPKGETTIKVHAYNLSEQVSEFEGIYTY